MFTPRTVFTAKDRADAERHIIACRALVDALQDDPRVERLYQAWRGESGLADLIARRPRATTPEALDDWQAEFLLTYFGAGVMITSVQLPPFVSKELRLPYPWLPLQLSATFQVRMAAEVGAPLQSVSVVADLDGTSARGRRAKGAGDSIRRNVHWFYRARVQEPPDTIAAIARAYANELVDGHPRARDWSRETDPRDMVSKGIERAKALLDHAEYLYPTPKIK